MTQWNSDIEASVRAAGDYADLQMKEMLRPDATAVASFLRMTFRAVAGASVLTQACQDAGYKFSGPGFSSLQGLVDLAEANGSDSANKIKTVIRAETELKRVFKNDPAIQNTRTASDVLRRIGVAKTAGIQYP